MALDDSKRLERRLNVLGVFLGSVFLLTGLTKLAGAPFQERLIQSFGFPPWVLLAVGAAEVIFAALVLIPATRPYGAMGIALVMAGATLTRAMTGVALPLMLLDAVLFSAAVWVVREQRPAFLAIHWREDPHQHVESHGAGGTARS
ncbi:MAG: DoxX family protein [Myxococcota bacterium]